jgi:hypothetical protein
MESRSLASRHQIKTRKRDKAKARGLATAGLVPTSDRAYALLALYRANGDKLWSREARYLALRALRARTLDMPFAHSLYKGARRLLCSRKNYDCGYRLDAALRVRRLAGA